VVLMMMMILHHMRHGRQDNHATNHVRCTKTQGRAGTVGHSFLGLRVPSQTTHSVTDSGSNLSHDLAVIETTQAYLHMHA
jgi:hypothetical protein